MNRIFVDSGIDWIGKIPSTWNLLPLRYASYEINKKNNPIVMTNVLSLTNTLGVVPYEEKGNQGNVSKEDYTQYKLAFKDTIIINSMNLKIGSVGLSNYDGCVSPVYYVLKNNDLSDIHYLNYIFQSDFQKYLGKFGKGILEIREKISMSDVFRSYIPLPPLSEQKKIAMYLDDKCNKINQIIDDNNKELQLLEEYKNNYITELYSELLKNNQSIKLKKITEKISKGETPKDIQSDFSDTYSYRFIKCENIIDDIIVEDPVFTIDEDTYEHMKRSQLQENDILFVIAGATIGKVATMPHELLPANTNQAVCFIRLINKDKTNVNFVKYFLKSNFIKDVIALNAVQSAQPNISMEDLGSIKVPFVNSDVMNKTVNEILNMENKINKVIEYRKKIIETLDDYKKSLIYEAVTGKKEV